MVYLLKWGMEDKLDRIMYDALENTARLFPACSYDYSNQMFLSMLYLIWGKKRLFLFQGNKKEDSRNAVKSAFLESSNWITRSNC